MIQSAARRPIIGITSYGRDEQRRFRVSVDYVDAVRRAGGVPVILPPGDSELQGVFSLLDGLVFTGGGDVAPALYEGRGHDAVYNVDPERDGAELWLVRRVVNTGLPALCICRGAQLLNVALGGTLIAHLPDVVGEEVAHRVVDPSDETGTGAVSHPIAIVPSSLLSYVVGTLTIAPASWHHQAAANVAPGLRVVARAPDGTVEAFEMQDHPFLIGVQWHPEITASTDPHQQRLFDALVAVAADGSARMKGDATRVPDAAIPTTKAVNSRQ